MNPEQRAEIQRHAEAVTHIFMQEAMVKLERMERERQAKRAKSKVRKAVRFLLRKK